VKRGELLAVGCRWRNGGVAPCLPGGYPAITMKDARAGIAGVFVDEDLDVRTLPVGPPDKAAAVTREAQSVAQDSRPLTGWALPPANILKPGTYTVWVSVGTRAQGLRRSRCPWEAKTVSGGTSWARSEL